jgi:hypothetical protein
MISSRQADETLDRGILAESLANDGFHTGTTPDFFFPKLEETGESIPDPRYITNVYEDERGPIMFVRGTKSLRLDIQFVDNADSERNAEAMLGDFEQFAAKARANGFTEIVFCSNSPGLRAFCRRRFKFREVDGELRKFL